VFMGEEAPRHPEFVIPTNPAYRKRAQGLLDQAASAIGYAEGGVISAFKGAIGRTSAPTKAQIALFMAGIVESGLRNLPYGDLDSRGALQIRDSTAQSMGINNMDPYASAFAFLTRGFWGKGGANTLAHTNPGMSPGMVAQNVQGSRFPERYDQVLGQAVAYLKGTKGGQGWDLLSMLNPAKLIGKLPGVGDLPSWLGGMGKWVLGQVKDFIKDSLSGLLGGSTGADLKGGLPGGVRKAIALAMSMGHPHPTTNQLTGGTHAAGSLHYAGRAVDFGDAGQSLAKMQTLFLALVRNFGSTINELFYDKMPWYIDNHRKISGQFGGHSDHIHLGFRKGGQFGGLPFLGSYHQGGVAPREGFAHVSRGERMTPAGGGTTLHATIDLGRGIQERVRLEFDDQGRQQRGAWRAGVINR
jgi:hypothetical protein